MRFLAVRSRRVLAPLLVAAGLTILGGDRPTRGQELSAFSVRTVAGFTVLLSPAFLADPNTQERVMWRLEEQLRGAVRVLPPHVRAPLRRVWIWVDPDLHLGGNAVFEPSALYISQAAANRPTARRRGQAGGIVLINLEAFIRSHGQGNLMLHELAHAYDDGVLNFADAGVRAAFAAARREGLYASVYHSSGVSAEAYANTRVQEYFAELTVAYFGRRSQTPHDRAELRAFDPRGHRAVGRAWGMRNRPGD